MVKQKAEAEGGGSRVPGAGLKEGQTGGLSDVAVAMPRREWLCPQTGQTPTR